MLRRAPATKNFEERFSLQQMSDQVETRTDYVSGPQLAQQPDQKLVRPLSFPRVCPRVPAEGLRYSQKSEAVKNRSVADRTRVRYSDSGQR